MGVFGALGGAVKKAVKPVGKVVAKAPGIGSAVGKVPGMGAAMGVGPSPRMTPPSPGMSGLAQAGAGIGNAFLQNRSPMPGGNNAIQPDQAMNPQPMNEAQSLRPSPMIQSDQPAQAMQDMSQMYGGPGPQQAQGIGPSPQMAPQMAKRMPQRYGRMM